MGGTNAGREHPWRQHQLPGDRRARSVGRPDHWRAARLQRVHPARHQDRGRRPSRAAARPPQHRRVRNPARPRRGRGDHLGRRPRPAHEEARRQPGLRQRIVVGRAHVAVVHAAASGSCARPDAAARHRWQVRGGAAAGELLQAVHPRRGSRRHGRGLRHRGVPAAHPGQREEQGDADGDGSQGLHRQDEALVRAVRGRRELSGDGRDARADGLDQGAGGHHPGQRPHARVGERRDRAPAAQGQRVAPAAGRGRGRGADPVSRLGAARGGNRGHVPRLHAAAWRADAGRCGE